MSQHGAAELLAFGISHKTAPVAVRERLALTTRDAARLVQELVEETEAALARLRG